MKCTTCKFELTNPRPSFHEIPRYYQSNLYISHTNGSKRLTDRAYRIARQYNLRNKEKLIAKLSKEKTLLDVGCGTGEFLAHMLQKNWMADGVEPSPDANQKAKEKTEKHIYSSLSEIPQKQYGIITLWHVLEHIHEPHRTLKQLYQLLKPAGKIIVAVPNRNSYDAAHYKKYWAAYDVPRHLWHFSQSHMEQLLQENGFALTGILPMKLDAYYVSLLSEKYKNPTLPKPLTYVKAFRTAWKSNLCARKTGEYSSLIYLAEKK